MSPLPKLRLFSPEFNSHNTSVDWIQPQKLFYGGSIDSKRTSKVIQTHITKSKSILHDEFSLKSSSTESEDQKDGVNDVRGIIRKMIISHEKAPESNELQSESLKQQSMLQSIIDTTKTSISQAVNQLEHLTGKIDDVYTEMDAVGVVQIPPGVPTYVKIAIQSKPSPCSITFIYKPADLQVFTSFTCGLPNEKNHNQARQQPRKMQF